MATPLDLTDWVHDVPDYPRPGIVFKDITPLLADPGAFAHAVDRMVEPYANADIDLVAGIESRGFIFGTAIAGRLDTGFIPIRKPGKLPRTTYSREYQLEYGTDTLEIHADALAGHHRVLVVDDVLATGGTLAAALELIEHAGAHAVGASVLIELEFLAGRRRLPNPDLLHRVIGYRD